MRGPQRRAASRRGLFSSTVPLQSGSKANVHTDPPGWIFPAVSLFAEVPPPRPDSTVTYWRPLWVYVIGWALIPELVWNCHTILPVSSSIAMNSPVSFPENTSPPAVVSIPDHIGNSISGILHLGFAVNGFSAA